MKKSKFIKIFCVILAIVTFALMAIGSGPSEEASEGTNGNVSENGGKTTQKTNDEVIEYTVGETSVVVWTNSINTKWIKVVIPVKNTGNTNLYLESSTVDLEDSNGSLVDALEYVSVYPQVIKPGETAYYFVETTYEGTVTDGLKAVPHVKAEKAKVECIRLEVSDLSVKDAEFLGAEIIGRVENTTSKEQSLVYVVANLFDKDNKLIGQLFTILSDKIAAGEKIGFSTNSLSFDISASDIASYDVYAFPFQYQF